MEWHRQAACRDEDPELFFPQGRNDVDAVHLAAVRAVCASCRVRTPCLEFALTHGQREGIWGGLTAHERKKLAVARFAATSAEPT